MNSINIKKSVLDEMNNKVRKYKNRNYLNTNKGNQIKVDVLIEMMVKERLEKEEAQRNVELLKMKIR